jgi:hypothetical protein
MILTKPALEEVSGYLGVGSLELLGAFFIVDGATNFQPVAESVFKTTTWTLIATVPLLVIFYVLGLVSSLGAEAAINRIVRPALTAELFAVVSTSGNELLVQRYADVERHTRLLHGCALAFLFLALGCWSEVRMLGEFGFVGYLCLAGGLLLSILCPLLASRLQHQLVPFIEAVRARSRPSA